MDHVYPYQGCSEVTARFVAQFYQISETFICTVYHLPILTIFCLFIVYSYYHQISLLKKKKKNNLACSMHFQKPHHFYFCEAWWDIEGKMRDREGRRKPIQGPHFLLFTKVLSGNCCSISWKKEPINNADPLLPLLSWRPADSTVCGFNSTLLQCFCLSCLPS